MVMYDEFDTKEKWNLPEKKINCNISLKILYMYNKNVKTPEFIRKIVDHFRK